MLEGVKDIYTQCAECYLPDWKSIDKNDLVRTAADLPKGPLKDGYVSAIMLKYWNKISQFYYRCKLVTTPEDIHEWLEIAVLYAMNRKPWEKEGSSIYNDVNGPDKVINRVMESHRLTFYQQLNRFNRKINSETLSLDTLKDDYSDIFIPKYTDDNIFEITEMVIKFFNTQEYMIAFIIDAVIYDDILKNKTYEKNLSLYLRKLDDTFCNEFANRYSLPVEKVKEGTEYVVNLTPVMLKKRLEYNIIRLKNILKEMK